VAKVRAGKDGLRGLAISEGSLESRLAAPDDASLVLFYGTDEGGSLAPCGCTDSPRGGLPRAARYIQASRAAQPEVPSLVLNAGGWSLGAVGMDGHPRADAPVANRWMTAGMESLGVDAANVGWGDMAGLVSLDEPPAFAVVSANLHGDGVAGELLHRIGGHDVLVTGIGPPGPPDVPIPGFSREDELEALRARLAGARSRADLIVLLSYATPTAARVAAEEGLVDLVIDANQHRFRDEPLRVGDAVWVRAYHQTQRLGELRIGLAPEGQDRRIAWATDRKIALDESLPEDPELRSLARQAEREVRKLQVSLFGQEL
jgi:2',3'-cyclic-nucleotide 2'-phosphodiesterase (5'-nucleotidase family)